MTETKQISSVLNEIKIGDLNIISNNLSVQELCSYSIWLLQQKEVIGYLNLERKRKALLGVN